MSKTVSQKLTASCGLLLFLASGAFAQQAPDGEKPNCRAPQTQQDGQSQSGLDQGTTGSTNLPPCDGVLVPPVTGDKGLEKQAPSSGNTPVVRPGDVPQQEPNMN